MSCTECVTALAKLLAGNYSIAHRLYCSRLLQLCGCLLESVHKLESCCQAGKLRWCRLRPGPQFRTDITNSLLSILGAPGRYQAAVKKVQDGLRVVVLRLLIPLRNITMILIR